MMSLVEQTLSAIPVVQAFTREEIEQSPLPRLRRRTVVDATAASTARRHVVQARRRHGDLGRHAAVI